MGILGIAAIALVAVGCGDSDSDSDADNGATQTTAATSTVETSPATSTADASSPTAAAESNPFEGVAGIVDPENHDWPREVEGINGVVSIEQQPQRIHTMSAGFDEITAALVPISRVAAVGSASQNPSSSSMSDLFQDLPTVAREPEAIATADPDIVIAPPSQKADVIAAIERLEIPVVQLELDPTPEGRIATILLLGYIYGEEERALELADEVQQRYDAVVDVTSQKPESERPVVLSTTKYSAITISGADTTFEGIVVAAGGVNGGTEAGIEGNAQSSMEGIVATNPDVIILPMPEAEGEVFKAELLAHEALAETPAVQNEQVHVVPAQLYTTNSFANVRAVEHLAHLLWPEDFPSAETAQFSMPAGE